MNQTNSFDTSKTALGIEFGSTRIKAVLIDESHRVLATGEHQWENRYNNGYWTYSLVDVKNGLQSCYASLKKDIRARYGIVLNTVGSIGISAMMHGYMVFDKHHNLLTPFRTWRNNTAKAAATALTKAFHYPIPARWSIAHVYQAIIDKEAHVKDIAFQTTLEGYIHYLLSGNKVIGIGEASGMFPIDLETKDYDASKIAVFEKLASENGFNMDIRSIFPKVLLSGENAGYLTKEGALLVDPDGDLIAGIPMCPPEGDAGTGMVATNCIKKRTVNVSAGTSIFSMAVLDGALSEVHTEIDLVTTPNGNPVAMVHCNNCTSEINAWMEVFSEMLSAAGLDCNKGELYTKLFLKALEGEPDCGGLLGYNYVSGEHITKVAEGCPMLLRSTESRFTLPNFMRMQIYSAFATLRLGMDILTKRENVKIDSVVAHGGIFKTKGVAQNFLAAALKAPVKVSQNANEGGPYGMALLAMYMLNGKGIRLEEYLDKQVFASDIFEVSEPDGKDSAGFDCFIERFEKGLPIVRTAVSANNG